MRSGVLILLIVLAVTPVLADDVHGGGETEWNPAQGMDYFPGMELGQDPNSTVGTEGEIPFVPNDIANWFEEYALQKSFEEKRDGQKRIDAAEIQSALNPVMIVQKKTVRTTSNGVVKTPIITDVKNTTDRSAGGTTASVNISQMISPKVIVNVPQANSLPAVEEPKEEEDTSSSEAIRRIQAYNKKVLENNFGKSGQKNGGGGATSGGLASSWKQFFASWFSRPSTGSRSGLSRRFEPLENEDAEVSEESEERPSERTAAREISAASSDSLISGLTSSDSWFGWVGWLVAFGLLGSLVVQLRRRPRH